MTRNVPYGETISTLTWAALVTRPVVTFADTSPFFAANAGPALLEAINRTSRGRRGKLCALAGLSGITFKLTGKKALSTKA